MGSSFTAVASETRENASQQSPSSGHVPSYARMPVEKPTEKPRPKRLPTVGRATKAEQPRTEATAVPRVTEKSDEPKNSGVATEHVAKSIEETKPAPTVKNKAEVIADAAVIVDAAAGNKIKHNPTRPTPLAVTPVSSLPRPALPKPVVAEKMATVRANVPPSPPTVQPPAVSPQRSVSTVNWLRSSSPASQQSDAFRLLDQATCEYNVGAWASAEASVWESLISSAAGLDLAHRAKTPGSGNIATADLKLARTAIREARDFAGAYGDLDSQGVKRIARSHLTNIVKDDRAPISGADAIDQYFNEARIRLSRIAAARVEAAQAMDLLAAIHLGRNERRLLPSQTALCLRRAALQGQPGNGSLALRVGMQLADLGLDDEARWALEHSMAIEPTQQGAKTLAKVLRRIGDHLGAEEITRQAAERFAAKPAKASPEIPRIQFVSPEQFAKLSPSVTMFPTSGTSPALTQQVSRRSDAADIEPVSYQQQSAAATAIDAASAATESSPLKSKVKRFFSPIGKLWQ